MKRGDVYWVRFDPRIGTEIKKTRPAVIVSTDDLNEISGHVQVAPITSNVSRCWPDEALVVVNGKPGRVQVHQAMAASRLRVHDFIGKLSPAEMRAVDEAIRVTFNV